MCLLLVGVNSKKRRHKLWIEEFLKNFNYMIRFYQKYPNSTVLL